MLVTVGLGLLVWAALPILVERTAGAAGVPTCKADGTDDPRVPCFFETEDEEGVPLASLRDVDLPLGIDLVSGDSLAPGRRFVRNQTALIQLGKALF